MALLEESREKESASLKQLEDRAMKVDAIKTVVGRMAIEVLLEEVWE